jgi:hypothetical protein
LAHVILADPWGFPRKPESAEEDFKKLAKNSMKMRFAAAVGHKMNPLSFVRAAGPMGN